MATLAIQDLRKSFGLLEVVAGIDLDIADQEFLVLVGPSGSGKSTILRMIAGLEDVTAGRILIDGALVNHREPKDRDIAMVFQDYALYPHMTVFDNLAFGLRYRKVPRQEIRRRVEDTARILEIDALMHRMPRELSGGQRQRVAMGRAIVRHPRIFLFDEPLSNLDARLRGQMRTELKKLRARIPLTAVFVTHDQVEAMTLADRIVVLNHGRIEQVGTPEEIYAAPASAFVAGFMGSPPMNLLPAGVLPHSPRGDATCGIRPEDIFLADATNPSFTAEVIAIEPLGPDTLVSVSLAGHELICRLPPGRVRASGQQIRLGFDPARLHMFDANTGQRMQTEGALHATA